MNNRNPQEVEQAREKSKEEKQQLETLIKAHDEYYKNYNKWSGGKSDLFWIKQISNISQAPAPIQQKPPKPSR